MKSIITIILILGIIYNSIGNIIVFSIYQASIRKEIRNYIKTDKSKKKIELLKFSKADLKKRVIRFVKHDEFIFNNQLYDIKRSKIVGDSIFYFCINDTKEINFLKITKKNLTGNLNQIQLRIYTPR